MADVTDFTDTNFDEEVLKSSDPVLVDFWAPWCGPCRMMEPILEEIAIEQADVGVRVVKVNVDEAPKTSSDFGIRSFPTLLFFQDGEPLFEMVGMVPKPVLARELEQLVGPGKLGR